ncbi:MAG: acylneuraminate cytidylyltransferase family protein [Candidatus Gastranaerophilales bacterium]|nr:acylneuraminate cytidylyltransferase family protein [Candidatus Gastranaerophilales bacterium]
MKILGIIPARGGSKGIPRKNIRLLAGKPLIAYTIEASLKSKYIDRTILSTEDAEIKEIAQKFGAEVMDRPFELAQDETKTAPVLTDIVNKLEHTGYSPDIVVLLQPTCPLRDENVIDAAIEKLINADNDSIFTCSAYSLTHALWKKELDGTMSCLYDYHLRPRRQDTHLHQRM